LRRSVAAAAAAAEEAAAPSTGHHYLISATQNGYFTRHPAILDASVVFTAGFGVTDAVKA